MAEGNADPAADRSIEALLVNADDEILGESRRRTPRGQRRRRALITVATLVVASIGVLTVSAFSNDPAATPPFGSAIDSTSTTPTSRPARAIEPVIRDIENLPSGRPLTHEDPLRLWVGGDSLSGAMGPVVGQYAEDSGVVRALIDYKVSSGLAARVRDWPEYAAELLAENDPEAIVFMVGANDAHIVSSDREAWEPDYRDKVADMMDLLIGGAKHRTIFWVGSPPMRLDARERGIKELNRVFAEEAEKRDDVVYIDAYTMFEGPGGGYDPSIVIPGEGEVRVRVGDGVHLTPAGAEWLGYNVWRLIDQRWDVGEYAQPDLPIDYRTEPGGGSSCCGSGGTSATTETTEAPIDSTTTTESCEVTATCETTTTIPETTTTVPETTTTLPEPTTTTAGSTQVSTASGPIDEEARRAET